MARDSEAFWDKASAKYARSPVSDMASYDHTMDRTRDYLSPEDRVLELGCGTGTTALRLAGNVAHITASDISSEMIAIARKKASDAAVTNVDFVHADIHAVGTDGSTYDAVLAYNLFHLAGSLPDALGAARALVKPGGLLISKTVCLSGNPFIRVLIAGMQFVGKAPPVTFMSISDLDREMTAAGFDILETGVFPKKPPSRFVVARRSD